MVWRGMGNSFPFRRGMRCPTLLGAIGLGASLRVRLQAGGFALREDPTFAMLTLKHVLWGIQSK